MPLHLGTFSWAVPCLLLGAICSVVAVLLVRAGTWSVGGARRLVLRSSAAVIFAVAGASSILLAVWLFWVSYSPNWGR